MLSLGSSLLGQATQTQPQRGRTHAPACAFAVPASSGPGLAPLHDGEPISHSQVNALPASLPSLGQGEGPTQRCPHMTGSACTSHPVTGGLLQAGLARGRGVTANAAGPLRRLAILGPGLCAHSQSQRWQHHRPALGVLAAPSATAHKLLLGSVLRNRQDQIQTEARTHMLFTDAQRTQGRSHDRTCLWLASLGSSPALLRACLLCPATQAGETDCNIL